MENGQTEQGNAHMVWWIYQWLLSIAKKEIQLQQMPLPAEEAALPAEDEPVAAVNTQALVEPQQPINQEEAVNMKNRHLEEVKRVPGDIEDIRPITEDAIELQEMLLLAEEAEPQAVDEPVAAVNHQAMVGPQQSINQEEEGNPDVRSRSERFRQWLFEICDGKKIVKFSFFLVFVIILVVLMVLKFYLKRTPPDDIDFNVTTQMTTTVFNVTIQMTTTVFNVTTQMTITVDDNVTAPFSDEMIFSDTALNI